jgi:predicted ATPase/DNA-binding SARP family transcriptional activator
MRFGVLGPIAAWTDEGRPVPISGAKVRALLADLVVHLGQPVAADRLVDDLWGESPDSTNPAGLLSSKVSQLRRALDAAEPGARALVVSPPPGYTLAVEATAVDAGEFTALVDEAGAAETADPLRAVDLLERALALWRGPAYGEVADLEFARGAIAHFDERRLTAYEALARARLALGSHARVADELTALVEAHPWREDLRLSHVLALYRAGRQPDALASFERYRRHLVDELGVDPSPAAAALHHAVLVQDPALVAPAPAVRVAGRGAAPSSASPVRRPPSNLPGRRSSLIGRDDDLAALVGAIESANLVTLVGPGGVGKTTLAVEAARHVADDRPDGAWFVDLSGVDRGRLGATADVVADEVTAALAIRQITDAPSSAPSVDRLGAALRGHEALLVLDNCEHVVEAAAVVADRLLRDAPAVTVVATSREPLGVAGEVVRTVTPLAVPAPRDQRDADLVAQFDAVQLFVARARAAGATIEIDPRTAPLLGTLCRRLDGLPLALELAATRVPALGLSEVVARLGDRFRLLGSGRRGGPERQRTLEAMLDWSWDLLDDDEQRVLRRLAVHADGCTLAAAVATCHDDVELGVGSPGGRTVDAEAATADLLGRLVERSLVVADHALDGTRYRLLESVGAYAGDRLVESGESDAVRRRHLDRCVLVAEQADAHLRGPDQAVWLATLDAESANMHVALDTAAEVGRPDLAHRLVAALGWYWTLRGRTAVALRAFERALSVSPEGATVAHARAACLRQAAAVTHGETINHVARSAAALAGYDALDAEVERGRSAMVLGTAAIDVGLVAEGEPLLDEAAAVAAAHGDRWGEAAALLGSALPAHMHGDLDLLRHRASRSEALFVEVDDAWGRLAAGEWLGALAELEGDLDTAEKVLASGLDEAERLGLWRQVASRLGLLGWIAHQREDRAAARDRGEQARRLAVEQADRAVEVLAVMVLGFTARQSGDLAGAEAHLRSLLDGSGIDPDALASGHVEVGDLPPHVVTVLAELGFVAELGGDPARALALHRAVVAAAVASGYPRDLAGALDGGAAALAALGEHEAAGRALGAAAAVRDAARLVPGTERRDADRARAAVAGALGRDALDRLLADGRGADPRTALVAGIVR